MAKNIKGRKFVATAASAALVASAIVPVASAATEFSDASSISSWATEAVDYLVSKNVLEGDEKGNFNPSKELTRGEAATVLAKALGLTIDTTKKTTLTDAVNHWSSSAIAALQASNPEIIKGYENGTFKPDGKITRQEFAKMIVTAFGLELVEGKDVNFTDNKGWGADFITILASNGIATGTSATTFGPEQNVTREAAATFAYRTLSAEQVALAVKAVEEAVKALPSVTTIVKSNSEDAAKAAKTAKAAITKLENLLKNAKVTDAEKATATKLLTDASEAVKAVEEKIKLVNVGNLAVTDATAVNTKAIVLTFNTSVDEISANDEGNFEIEVAGAPVAFTAVFDTKNPTQVTLVPTAAIANNAAVRLTVKKSLLNTGLVGLAENFTKVYVSSDVTAPTISKVEPSGADVVVTFSEEIDSSIGLVKFNEKTYTSGYTVTGNKLTITGAATGLAAGNYSLILNNVSDKVPTSGSVSNPNVSGLLTGTLTVSTDTTVPTVSKVTQVNDSVVKVTFNKPVTSAVVAPVVVTKNGYPLIVTHTGTNASNTEYTYTLADNGSVKVYDANTESSVIAVNVSGFKDTAGTIANAYVGSITITKDSTGPVVASRFNEIKNIGTGGTTNEVFDIYFDEIITTTVSPSAIVLTDKNGIRQTVTGVSIVADTNGDNKILRVESTNVQTAGAIKEGEYNITLAAGSVKDTSSKTNGNLATTVKFTKSGASTSGVSASAAAASNVITVTYGSEMTSSATTPANYLLDGKVLPAGTVVYFQTDNKNVKIQLPDASVAVTGGAVLTITDNVVSTTGVKVNAASKNISIASGLIDNIKPVLASAKKTSTSQVELTFSEAVALPGTASLAIDDFVLTINGVEVTPTAIAAGTTSNKLVLTLPTYNTAQEVKVSVSATATIDVKDTPANNLLTRGTVVVAQ